jgi:hypothetical protein
VNKLLAVKTLKGIKIDMNNEEKELLELILAGYIIEMEDSISIDKSRLNKAIENLSKETIKSGIRENEKRIGITRTFLKILQGVE